MSVFFFFFCQIPGAVSTEASEQCPRFKNKIQVDGLSLWHTRGDPVCTEEARVPLGTKRAYTIQFWNSSSTEIGLEVSKDLTLKKRLENLNFPRFPEPYDRTFTAQPHIGDNLVLFITGTGTFYSRFHVFGTLTPNVPHFIVQLLFQVWNQHSSLKSDWTNEKGTHFAPPCLSLCLCVLNDLDLQPH